MWSLNICEFNLWMRSFEKFRLIPRILRYVENKKANKMDANVLLPKPGPS